MIKVFLKLKLVVSTTAIMISTFSISSYSEEYSVEDCSSGVCIQVPVAPPTLPVFTEHGPNHNCEDHL